MLWYTRIFLDSHTSNKDGKLRLLYESAPMSMILEQAGGAGSTGRGRILDVKPSKIHERYVVGFVLSSQHALLTLFLQSTNIPWQHRECL